MTIIEINKRFYTVPTSWNELTCRQLLQVMEIIYSNISITRANLKMLQVLTGISKIRFMLAPVPQLAEYFYLVEFFYKNNDLTKNLLPHLRGRYGPADDFDNLKAGEYTFTELYYQHYMDTKEEKALNQLIGILYRKPKPLYSRSINAAGDVRRHFINNLVDHYGNMVRRWPRKVKYAILTWYAGCRLNLERNNPRVFNGEDGEPPQYGMWSIMRSVAEKGNHGTFEKVEAMYLKELMMELNEITAESDRLKNYKPNAPK